MDPVVLARIGNLELVSRAVVDGFINGLHKAPYFGASVDFAEHRGYVPGDDIRRMDWRVWARTDRYYIKEYEAESNMNFSVLLDVSKSMDYGGKGIKKIDYARIIAACLTSLVSTSATASAWPPSIPTSWSTCRRRPSTWRPCCMSSTASSRGGRAV
jgi:uncharacterized protein (DUF58 family)